MKKKLLVFIVMACTATFTFAQDYSTGIGVRGGLSNGVTIKHFIRENIAVEGLVSTRWRGFDFTGLYEIHKNAFDINRLNWYYGIGGHIGFWNGTYTTWGDSNTDYVVIGIDAILGLEYNFEELPINISADWKPGFNLIGYSGFWPDGGALSIRYIF